MPALVLYIKSTFGNDIEFILERTFSGAYTWSIECEGTILVLLANYLKLLCQLKG